MSEVEEITFEEYGRRIKSKDQVFSYAPLTGAYLAAIRNYNSMAAAWPEKFPDYVSCINRDDIRLIPNPFRKENQGSGVKGERREMPQSFPDKAQPKGRKGVTNEVMKDGSGDRFQSQSHAIPSDHTETGPVSDAETSVEEDGKEILSTSETNH